MCSAGILAGVFKKAGKDAGATLKGKTCSKVEWVASAT
jgi:hypothetical protein